MYVVQVIKCCSLVALHYLPGEKNCPRLFPEKNHMLLRPTKDWHHMFFTPVVMPQKINHKMNYGDFHLYKQCKAYENQTVRPGRWRYNSSTVPQSTSKTAKKLSSTIYLTYVTRRDQHLTLTTKLFMCKSYNFFGEMFTLKLWNNWV